MFLCGYLIEPQECALHMKTKAPSMKESPEVGHIENIEMVD